MQPDFLLASASSNVCGLTPDQKILLHYVQSFQYKTIAKTFYDAMKEQSDDNLTISDFESALKLIFNHMNRQQQLDMLRQTRSDRL